MKADHLEIGTIQAFLDGELTPAESAKVSTHIAACDTCALSLAEAEDESAVVFPALAREMDSLVPTQRLWNKISHSIETERERVSVWGRARSFVTAAFLSPSIAAAASLLIVIGFVAAVWMNRSTAPQPVSGTVATAVAPLSQTTVSDRDIPVVTAKAADQSPSDRPALQTPRFERASYRVSERRSPIASVPSGPAPDAGEDSYIKTIASLARTADGQKDGMMRASERVSYERDMAVVDDTISKMRAQVKKNPKNDSARQMLYTSYQNKIDLLNSVSQKQELMASLR